MSDGSGHECPLSSKPVVRRCDQTDLADVGALWIYAEVKRDRASEQSARTILDNLLGKLRTRGMSEAELQEAKNTIIGRQARRYESNAQLAALYQQSFLTTPYGMAIENSIEAIERVSTADILRVARTRFAGDEIFRAAARPPATYAEASLGAGVMVAAVMLLLIVSIRSRRKADAIGVPRQHGEAEERA